MHSSQGGSRFNLTSGKFDIKGGEEVEEEEGSVQQVIGKGSRR